MGKAVYCIVLLLDDVLLLRVFFSSPNKLHIASSNKKDTVFFASHSIVMLEILKLKMIEALRHQ